MIKKCLFFALLPLLMVGCVASDPEPNHQLPTATIEMEDSSVIQIELYPDIAPATVDNFIELANSGFYDGLTFHRVIPGFMIQGGCPLGNGTGGPGHTIEGEFAANEFENDLSHEAGTVSMARQPNDFDSAGSQFFITVADAQYLDGEYAAFGRVISESDLEVAERIAHVDKDANDIPLEPQVIKSIKVALGQD